MLPPLQIPSNEWQTITIVACIFHGSAIATTCFRLGYRLCTSTFWWEDAWAAIALAFDIVCLFGVWGESPMFNDDPSVYTAMFWLLPIAFTCVLWCVVESCMFFSVAHVNRAARMSIIYPILRVTDPRGPLRKIVYAVISSFAVMWTALVIQKLLACVYHGCHIGSDIAVADLVTDAVSDLMLVVTPMYVLRDIRLIRPQRILVTCVFCASLLITAVSIPLSTFLLIAPKSNTALIFGHVKPATALIIANLLVIVSFVYRCMRYSKENRLSQTGASGAAEFSTCVDLDHLTMDRHWSIAQTSSTTACTMISTQGHP
ncbi:hypothetical protein CY34DRAFT_574290 [Suillus luteus UH-Slu-Lm8-n1]|uniref:Integral membrane protein n=1 Tax=Suillus luteus UH-Slu-Lm8-n1 TaxID=930992 RepID=A0A0D0A4M7_9AGAM|nr:hypothetical protein CY34DRAFT_574290 [Suillus luteus UH-Slu-Lm8-n1]